MDDAWEVVPSKKQLRQEQQERRQQVEQQQQQQQQQQQHQEVWGLPQDPGRFTARHSGASRGKAQDSRGKGAGKGSMAAPSVVSTPLTVIVLVGTPGCGKSTFCAALNDALARSTAIPGVVPQPVRVSQDDLGGRKACEALSESALRAGHNIVIDRCNFDQQQRSTWLRIGKRFGATVVAAFLNTSIETCKQRVMRRTKHPTLGPTAESMAVVDRFRSMLKPPHESEGFSLIVEAGEDMGSVQTAAQTLADHLVAAMLVGLPAPESAAAAFHAGEPVSRSFSMQAMEKLLTEPSLSASQRAAAAAALAQQQDAGAAFAAVRPCPTGGSSELEQARLEGEVRALNRLAAATRPPANGGAAMSVTTAPAAHPAELLQIRAEIDRLRSELGLETSRSEASAVASSNSAGGYLQFNINAPAWQPSRKW